MDVKFINPFLQGTIEVLKKMTFTDPTPGKVYLKEGDLAAGDVSGIIGITGDAVGSLAISFTESCICHVVGRMLGEHYATAGQEVFDAVGELTNMISGVARTHLEKEGMSVYAAIPSVVYGKQHTINHILDSPSIVIPFSTEKGMFVVDVCLKRAAPGAVHAEDYQVVNRRTLVNKNPSPPASPASSTAASPASPASPAAPTAAVPAGPMEPADRIALLKKQMREIMLVRDDIVRQLSEKPFMEINQRTLFKKKIPFLDAKIRRMKLDISATEMLSKITQDDLDNPKLVKHYQHYDGNKRNR